MKFKMLCDLYKLTQKQREYAYIPSIVYALNEKGLPCEIKVGSYNFEVLTVAVFIAEKGGQQTVIAEIKVDSTEAEIANKIFEYISINVLGTEIQTTVKLFGVSHNYIQQKLAAIENSYKGSIVTFTYSDGLISTIKALTSNRLEGSCAVSDIFSEFKRYIYAEEDVTLSFRLLDLLKVRNKKISIAESITGGEIASELIKNAGASEVFYEGIVCYSNDSKIKRLGVDRETIKNYGAVSSETAYEMAAGLLSQFCDIAIATTGIAGPSGGSLSKPVGLTYISIGTSLGVHVYKHIFNGDRDDVRINATNAAIFYAIKNLKDNSINYDEISIN